MGEISFNSHLGSIHWDPTQQSAAMAILGSQAVGQDVGAPRPNTSAV